MQLNQVWIVKRYDAQVDETGQRVYKIVAAFSQMDEAFNRGEALGKKNPPKIDGNDGRRYPRYVVAPLL